MEHSGCDNAMGFMVRIDEEWSHLGDIYGGYKFIGGGVLY